jgi:hypothetical protein
VNTVFRLLFLLLVAAASSCVFPTHFADKNPYGSQSIGLIVLNETSREEASATLGAPVRVFSNGRWWLYQSDRRMTEWIWFFCAQTGCGGGEFGGALRLYSLLLEFGDEDVVSNLTVLTDQHPCTDDETVCYADGRLTVVHEFATAARIYSDESSYATLTDIQLQALRGEETDRFSGTSDRGIQVELIERGGLVFDAGSMKPFTGHITKFEDCTKLEDCGVWRTELTYDAGKLDGPVIWEIEDCTNFEDCVVLRAELTYDAGKLKLDGPMVIWERDGSVLMEACIEDGDPVTSTKDNCPR